MIFIDDDGGWYSVHEVGNGQWVWTRTSGESSHEFASKKSALKDLLMQRKLSAPVWEAMRKEFDIAVEEESRSRQGRLNSVVVSLALSVLVIIIGILVTASGNVAVGVFFRVIGNVGLGASVIWAITNSGMRNKK